MDNQEKPAQANGSASKDRIGIKDVAKLAGVSPATVSRVLGNGPVSGELRARVEEAVALSGYRPNLAARRLRSQQSGTIGLLVADICNPFFTAVSKAVEKYAYQANWRLIFCNSDEDPEREAMYLRLLAEESLDGLIIAPTRSSSNKLKSTPECPIVLIDRVGSELSHDAVTLDNQTAMAMMVEHLIQQGYRKIGGIFGNTSSTGLERRESFVRCMQGHGLDAGVREASPNAESGEKVALQWLSQADKPEALIGSNSLFLTGIIKAANSLNLSIPQDLAVASFDNEPWTELVNPGITVIQQPVDDIGQNAVALLKDRIQNNHRTARKIVLKGELVERGSTQYRTRK